MSVKMVLGTYTFDLNPEIDFDLLKKKKKCAYVETYDDVHYFSWGSSYIGKVIELKWEWMSLDQYDEFQTMYEADEQIEFDPVDTEGIKFNVHIVDLEGVYWLRMIEEGTEETFRKDVTMKLLIMSEAT